MCEGIIRAEIFKEFSQYRINSDWWNKGYQANLNSFDRYCIQHFPNDPMLTQDMLNGWYEKKPTECHSSTRSRTQVVTTLIRYTQKRYHTSLYVPELPVNCKKQYIPHSFSNEELTAFFTECDNHVLAAPPGESALKDLTISVIFRTLYSTGMRTTEARLLKTEEISFDDGVVSITSTKGGRQHFVVLDSVLKSILLRYQFQRRWKKVNPSHVSPYDLRHNYAVRNINRWIASGVEFHDKFLYLSKSMGHTRLESTKYYYHLVPKVANILYDCSNESFDDIVPEVYRHEKK